MIIKSFKTSAVSQTLTVAIGGGQSFFIVLLRAVIHQGGSSLGPDSHSSLLILCLQNKQT